MCNKTCFGRCSVICQSWGRGFSVWPVTISSLSGTYVTWAMWHSLCHWCWNGLSVSRAILTAVLPVSIEKLWSSVIRSPLKIINSGQDHELSSLSHSIEPNLEFFILSETKSGILINDELSFSNTLSGSIFNRPTKFLGLQNGFPFFGIGNLSISIIFAISGSTFSDFSSVSIFSGSFGFTKKSYRDSKDAAIENRNQRTAKTGDVLVLNEPRHSDFLFPIWSCPRFLIFYPVCFRFVIFEGPNRTVWD